MGLNSCALGMAVMACCCWALLGAELPGLGAAGSSSGSQALVRFIGWQAWAPHVLVASLLAWSIMRCEQVRAPFEGLPPLQPLLLPAAARTSR